MEKEVYSCENCKTPFDDPIKVEFSEFIVCKNCSSNYFSSNMNKFIDALNFVKPMTKNEIKVLTLQEAHDLIKNKGKEPKNYWIKEWLDCNGFEDMTTKNGEKFYSEETVIDLIDQASNRHKYYKNIDGNEHLIISPCGDCSAQSSPCRTPSCQYDKHHKK